jgi:hypothetical protein
MYFDASLSGWGGAALNGASANGPWTSEDDRHKNELELLAALWALKSLTAGASNIAIQLMLDNRTAVAYVYKSGGTHSKNLCTIVARIARWCEDHLLTVSAVYLPGALNILADRLSRMRPNVSDWIQLIQLSSVNYRPFRTYKRTCFLRNGINSWITLYQLAAPTGCDGRGFIQPELEPLPGICIQSILLDSPLPEQNKEGSGGDDYGSPDLASATLVPSFYESGVRAPSNFAKIERGPV